MKKLVFNEKDNMLLTKYIMNSFSSLNYGNLMKALRNKDIKVNSKRINKDVLLYSGDIIEIYITDSILFNLPEKIKYYYADENILIAYKWQGIISNNEENINLEEPTFEELVKKDLNLNTLFLCHRLDRNTSGLLIFAKSKEIFEEVKKCFENFEIEKHYLAYVYDSKFKNTHEVLNAYLVKDKKTKSSKIYTENVPNSEKIVTEYSVIYTNVDLNYAILDVILHTGKMHQIRSHLSYIGYPIIGDGKYGKNDINKKFKKSKQLLVAYKYKFNISKNNMLSYLNDKTVQIEKEMLNLL